MPRHVVGDHNRPTSTGKGKGFKQPTDPNLLRHCGHIDFTCLNLSGAFHFLCAVLDCQSRAILG